MRARGDELQDLRQLRDETNAASLCWGKARHETAEVDASSEAEGGGDISAELAGVEGAVGGEGDFDSDVAEFGEADLVAEAVDVVAELDLVHAVALEGFEAGDL